MAWAHSSSRVCAAIVDARQKQWEVEQGIATQAEDCKDDDAYTILTLLTSPFAYADTLCCICAVGYYGSGPCRTADTEAVVEIET